MQFALAVVALCALVAIAYSNSLDNGFVWDDHEQIVMNPYIKPGAPLAPIFTSDVRFAHQGPSVQTRVYRPLQLLTYRTLVDWFGPKPEAFHFTSMVFAACGALVALAVFWLMTRRLALAFAAAALFAVHPVHTEAVDWIAALPDLGMGLFTLLAFAFFLAARNAVNKARARWSYFSASLLTFAVALLWKETAVVFPLLVAAYIALVEQDRSDGVAKQSRAQLALNVLKKSAPYWAVLAAYLALRFAVLRSFTAGPRTWSLNAVQFVLSALHLMLLYCGKLLLPLDLNAYYIFNPLRSLAELSTLLTLVLTLAAVVAIVYLVRRAPLAAFAALWLCLTLIPALNLNGLGRNPFAERYLYLPSAGFCLLVALTAAWLLQRLPSTYRKAAGGAVLVLVLAAFSVETIARNEVWKDDDTLFNETLKLSPDAPFVRYMVAAGQSANPSQWPTAEANYMQTAALAQQQLPPDRLNAVAAYKGLASLYADRGQFGPAVQALGQARAIAPDDPDLAGEEGIILAQAGHGAEAEALLTRALATQPDNENVLSALGLIARDVHHDLGKSADFFSRALAAHTQQDDFSASQHNNLAAVYADGNNYAGAVAELKQAIAIAPGDPEYYDNLASALAATGHFDEARVQAQTALQMNPNDGNAREILQRLSRQ